MVALNANKTYFFELNMLINAGGGGWKVALTIPTSATASWGATGALMYRTTTFAVQADATISIEKSGASSDLWFGDYGRVIVGANAGNLQVQWSQVSASSSTIVKEGSSMRGWEEIA